MLHLLLKGDTETHPPQGAPLLFLDPTIVLSGLMLGVQRFLGRTHVHDLISKTAWRACMFLWFPYALLLGLVKGRGDVP